MRAVEAASDRLPAYLLVKGFRVAESARAVVLRLAGAVEVRGLLVGLVVVVVPVDLPAVG